MREHEVEEKGGQERVRVVKKRASHAHTREQTAVSCPHKTNPTNHIKHSRTGPDFVLTKVVESLALLGKWRVVSEGIFV